jgi:hypothetical protein
VVVELDQEVQEVEHLVNHVVDLYPEELEMRVALPYQKEIQVGLTLQDPEKVVAVVELQVLEALDQVVQEQQML